MSILSQTGRGYYVIGVLGVGKEPTNHALHDIAKMKKQLDQWGRPFVLLFTSEEEAEAFRQHQSEFPNLPKNTIYGIDKDGSILRQLVAQLRLPDASHLPVFIIADTFDRIVFASSGYTIGLGEQLVKVADQL